MRKIDEATKANARELAKATVSGHTVIMDCVDTRTNTPVFVLCAVNTDKNIKVPGSNERGVELVPFAIILEGNPYEYLRPPDVEEIDGKGVLRSTKSLHRADATGATGAKTSRLLH